MIRGLFAFSTMFLGLLLLAFRSGEAQRQADFVYVNPSDIHTLDPARMSWTQDFRVALNLWQGLTTYDARTCEPIAGVAHFPPRVSPDALTYTFTIREDAAWSNGDPVVAADFIRGWRRNLEPGTAADYTVFFTDVIAGAHDYTQWRQDGVAKLKGAAPDWSLSRQAVWERHVLEFDARFEHVGVRAIDLRTLEVRLIRPCAYFVDLVASPPFLPCHESIESMRMRVDGAPITREGLVIYDPQWTKPTPTAAGYPGLITNGPYQLQEWTFKRRARLVANPHYHDAAAVSCQSVDMLVIPNVDAAIIAYDAGDVDFLPSLDVPYDHEIARLALSGERTDFKLCPAQATHFLNFNCVSPEAAGRVNPFVDPRVRRAFALAVDKQAIVRDVLRRADRPASSLVPPESMPHYVPPDGLAFDADQARRTLADAGFAGGLGLGSIELLYTASDERVCQALARMWERELGVRMELRSKESKTFADDKQKHRYMIARGNWYADYNDPTTFLDILSTGNGNNDSGYSNAVFDQLLDQARVETDPTRRAALLARAEAIIVREDVPILPLLHPTVSVAISPRVQGLHANPRLWFPFWRIEASAAGDGRKPKT